MKTFPALSWFAALGLSLAVAGCNLIPPPAPDPTRYYVLTSPEPEPAVTRVAQGSVRIGLRAVELAPYLRKGVLVVRHGENELVFDDFARWGEPLEAGIGRDGKTRGASCWRGRGCCPTWKWKFRWHGPKTAARHHRPRCKGVGWG